MTATTINDAEIAKFTAMAEEWWDPKGKFKPLHKFNPVRLGYIREHLIRQFGRDPQSIYYPILFFCILAAIAATSLASSRIGRAWNAMREDESVAEATGVNTTNYKLLAFGLGAAFGCVSGALFAAKIGVIFADSFNILVSINALALIILGGMGNIAGVVLGAFVLVGLPEFLREFAEYRLLIYGAVLVVMMLLRPTWPT